MKELMLKEFESRIKEASEREESVQIHVECGDRVAMRCSIVPDTVDFENGLEISSNDMTMIDLNGYEEIEYDPYDDCYVFSYERTFVCFSFN